MGDKKSGDAKQVVIDFIAMTDEHWQRADRSNLRNPNNKLTRELSPFWHARGRHITTTPAGTVCNSKCRTTDSLTHWFKYYRDAVENISPNIIKVLHGREEKYLETYLFSILHYKLVKFSPISDVEKIWNRRGLKLKFSWFYKLAK